MCNYDQNFHGAWGIISLCRSPYWNRDQGGIKAAPIGNFASNKRMKKIETSIFDQQYRVVAVESDRLLVRGILSGDVLTIMNPDPAVPISQQDYPPGKLIALSDPSTAPLN
jgi:hypothetical protein